MKVRTIVQQHIVVIAKLHLVGNQELLLTSLYASLSFCEAATYYHYHHQWQDYYYITGEETRGTDEVT